MKVWLSMEERLARTEKLIENLAGDAELKSAASVASIDDATLARGTQLVKAAHDADLAQVALDAAWAKIRAERKALRDEMVATYIQHRRVARFNIEDIELRKLLNIQGERERAVIEQHAQMLKFYSTGLSNADALKTLTSFGITREMLEAGRTKLAQITTLVHQETSTKAKKEEATDARDDALDAMDAWYAKTLKGLEYATSDNPALLKRLGA